MMSRRKESNVFAEGNTLAASKKVVGAHLVTMSGRPGYYIRWYEPRQIIQDYSVLIPQTGEASVRETRHGLVVTGTPQGNQFGSGLIAKDDVILMVDGRKIATIADFKAALNGKEGTSVYIRVNKGGKRGTIPRFEKAGANQADAKVFFANWSDQRDMLKTPQGGSDMTFTQLAAKYLDWAKTSGGYSPPWLAQVTDYMNRFVKQWGAIPISRITTEMIDQWAKQRLVKVKPVSARLELAPLRMAFKCAVKWQYLEKNPVASVEIRKSPRTLPKNLSETELQKLVDMAEIQDRGRLTPGISPKGGHTISPLGGPEQMRRYYNSDGTFDAVRIRFLALTALRKSQLVDLRWLQYDMDAGTLTLQPDEIHREKGRRPHILPLPNAAKILIAGQPRNSDFIFPNLKGERDVHIRSRFEKIAKLFQKDTGRHVHLHMLRHTALTNLLKYSQNIAAVSKYAGHADIKTTQVYAHVLDQQLKEITKDFDFIKPPAADAAPSPHDPQPAAKPSKRRPGKPKPITPPRSSPPPPSP